MTARTARTCCAFLAAVAIIATAVAAAVLAATRAEAVPRAMARADAASASASLFTGGSSATAIPEPLAHPSPADKPVELRMNASSQAGLPVAGHGYQFYVDITNLAHPPDWALRLFIDFSGGLTLAGGAPPGCFPVPGGLFCFYLRLGGEDSISLTINVNVARGLSSGSQVGISASLHYDEEFSAYASVYRPVVTPTPPPTHTPPPPTHTPPPTRTPPPRHSHPGPPPSHHPGPVPPVSHPAAVPPPRIPHHPKPGPHLSRPAPAAFSANPKRAIASIAAPHPVIPIFVLLAAVLTPCVAAAATRFGRHIHHR